MNDGVHQRGFDLIQRLPLLLGDGSQRASIGFVRESERIAQNMRRHPVRMRHIFDGHPATQGLIPMRLPIADFLHRVNDFKGRKPDDQQKEPHGQPVRPTEGFYGFDDSVLHSGSFDRVRCEKNAAFS